MIDLIQALRSPYRQGASFVMNSATLSAIRKFKTSDGAFLWQPGLIEGRPDTLLGYPVIEAEDMPDVAANAYSIAFGNFRAGYLRVRGEEEDALIAGLVRSATALCEQFTGQALLARGVSETIPASAEWRRLGSHHINRMRDIDMRMAILKARLSRAPADIDAAEAEMSRNYSPLLRMAGPAAYERGDSFCDVYAEEVAEACKSENNFEERVMNYWRNRAALDTLMAGDPAIAMRLLEQRQFARGSRNYDRYDQEDDDRISLLLLQADAALRLAAFVATSGGQSYGKTMRRQEALRILSKAQRLAPPHLVPGRFRQIAERYLSVHDALVAEQDDQSRPDTSPDMNRNAAYLRVTLANLPGIAVGDPAR